MVLSAGRNVLPTVHILDLVKYVSCIAAEDPNLNYLLAVDGSYGTQNEIVEGIAHSLGRGKTRYGSTMCLDYSVLGGFCFWNSLIDLYILVAASSYVRLYCTCGRYFFIVGIR